MNRSHPGVAGRKRSPRRTPAPFRVCRDCKRRLPIASFYVDTKHLDGRKKECRDCNLASQKIRRDGRSLKGTQCDVCGSTGNLHLDHDHKRHLIRGTLCIRCNHVLGLVDEDPDRLEKLATYLTFGGLPIPAES